MMLAWLPSQNGLLLDAPQRQRATRFRLSQRLPLVDSTTISPRNRLRRDYCRSQVRAQGTRSSRANGIGFSGPLAYSEPIGLAMQPLERGIDLRQFLGHPSRVRGLKLGLLGVATQVCHVSGHGGHVPGTLLFRRGGVFQNILVQRPKGARPLLLQAVLQMAALFRSQSHDGSLRAGPASWAGM